MGKIEEEKNPNPMIPDLLEEFFHRLPVKSILRFKTVSKEWRSILESKLFVNRHMSLQKMPKLLAVGDQTVSGFKGDEEIEVVYLHCNDATRPSLTCEGLVCIPVRGYINVLNPLTRQLLRFPCFPRAPVHPNLFELEVPEIHRAFFPGNWSFGFGRDKVSGSYKVVRMHFSLPEKCLSIAVKSREYDTYVERECHVLDVDGGGGQWRKLNPPPYYIDVGKKSVCLNGSIYWVRVTVGDFRILALNLHTLEFHNVSVPSWGFTHETQIANFEDRLAIVRSTCWPMWKLDIMTMVDAQNEFWALTYSINLPTEMLKYPVQRNYFMPITVSSKSGGNLFLVDNYKNLFKYDPHSDEICCIASGISVISSYVESLVSFHSESKHCRLDYKVMISNCGLSSKHLEP